MPEGLEWPRARGCPRPNFKVTIGPDDPRDASYSLEQAFLPEGLHDCLNP